MGPCDAKQWEHHKDQDNCYIDSSCEAIEPEDYVVYYGTVRNEKNEPVAFHKSGCCCQSTCIDSDNAACCYSKNPCEQKTDILAETDIYGFLEDSVIRRVTKDWYCNDDYILKDEDAQDISNPDCHFDNDYKVQNVTNFFNLAPNESNKNQLLWLGIDDLDCWSSLGGPRFRIQLQADGCFVYAEILVLPSTEKGPFIKASYTDDLSNAEIVDGLSTPISYWTHSGVNLHSG